MSTDSQNFLASYRSHLNTIAERKREAEEKAEDKLQYRIDQLVGKDSYLCVTLSMMYERIKELEIQNTNLQEKLDSIEFYGKENV